MTTPRSTPSPAAERRGLFALIADVPKLVGDLVRAEIASLKAEIAAKLKQGYIREPHVAVEIEAYRPFFILGEVTYPGQYPYVANMSVETAVAIAGGFSPRAKRNAVELSRPYMGQIVKGTVPPQTLVRPGDTITVAERWF